MPNIDCYGTKQQEKINRAYEHDFWKKEPKEDRSNNSSEFCDSCPLNRVVVFARSSKSFLSHTLWVEWINLGDCARQFSGTTKSVCQRDREKGSWNWNSSHAHQ
jgi:hypothetical protein